MTLLKDLILKYGCKTMYKREGELGEILLFIGERKRVLADDTNTVKLILEAEEKLLDDTIFYIDDEVYYLESYTSCTLNCNTYEYCIVATNKQPLYPPKIKALISIFKRDTTLTYRKCDLNYVFDIPNRLDYTSYELETKNSTKRLDGENRDDLISHILTIPYHPKIEVGMTVFKENEYWRNKVLDDRQHRDNPNELAHPNSHNLERAEHTANMYLNEPPFKGKYFEIYSMTNLNELNQTLKLNLIELGETDNSNI